MDNDKDKYIDDLWPMLTQQIKFATGYKKGDSGELNAKDDAILDNLLRLHDDDKQLTLDILRIWARLSVYVARHAQDEHGDVKDAVCSRLDEIKEILEGW